MRLYPPPSWVAKMNLHFGQSTSKVWGLSVLTCGFGSSIGSINSPQFSQRTSTGLFYRWPWIT